MEANGILFECIIYISFIRIETLRQDYPQAKIILDLRTLAKFQTAPLTLKSAIKPD